MDYQLYLQCRSKEYCPELFLTDAGFGAQFSRVDETFLFCFIVFLSLF